MVHIAAPFLVAEQEPAAFVADFTLGVVAIRVATVVLSLCWTRDKDVNHFPLAFGGPPALGLKVSAGRFLCGRSGERSSYGRFGGSAGTSSGGE